MLKSEVAPAPAPHDPPIVADSREKVADSREPKKPTSSYKGYTDARREANKRWAKDKAQISIKISADLKAQIDGHVTDRGEKLAAFVVRAIKEQMERDSRKAV